MGGEELDSVSTGESEFVGMPPGYYPTKLYLNQVALSIPFTTADAKRFRTITDRMYYEEPELQDEYAKYGAIYLWGESVPMHFLSTKSVTKLEDFKGMKIAMTGAVWPKVLEAVGAVPLPTALMDRPTGLQTGLLDGSVLLADLHVVLGMHESAKYSMYLDWSMFAGGHEVMNLALYESLPKELQKIIMDAAKEAAHQYDVFVIEDLKWAEEEMRKAGVVFNPRLSWEDNVRWSELTGELVAEWVREGEARGLPAREVAAKFIQFTKETGHVFPKEWALD